MTMFLEKYKQPADSLKKKSQGPTGMVCSKLSVSLSPALMNLKTLKENSLRDAGIEITSRSSISEHFLARGQ